MNQALRRSAYAVMELATLRRGIKRYINGQAIRLPPEVARYYSGSYEPMTHAFLRRHTAPGTVAIDAGAHIGLFTVEMARDVGADGRVLSFEPTASTARLLRRTVELNALDDVVDCRQEAVSAAAGFLEFFVDRHKACNANSLIRTAGAVGSVRVPTVSIDELIAAESRRVSCVKIDVEGAEVDVLRGAQETLRSDRPALALDIHPAQLAGAGGSVEDVWDMLADAGYTAVLGDTRLVRDETVALTEIFEMHAVAAMDG